MLNNLAREFAAEIAHHDWSDAPWRLDRAGHHRDLDTRLSTDVLTEEEADRVRTNVMWVAAQVLSHNDPNFDVHEFAVACGVPRGITHNKGGDRSGTIFAGLRMSGGRAVAGGTWGGNVRELPDPLTQRDVVAGRVLGGEKTHAVTEQLTVLCGAKSTDGSDPYPLGGEPRTEFVEFDATTPLVCSRCLASWSKLPA